MSSNLLSLLKESKIVIPPIQRDYAQGRIYGKVPTIRERFLDSIYQVLADENESVLELDFIYGFTETDKQGTDEIKIFKPLDGQQRLTTLFLLHWYAAQKEQKMDEAQTLLTRFSYQTRQSSRSFCQNIIEKRKIDWEDTKKVDENIVNQPWFFSNWKNDPTIQSMLVVLRAIDVKFGSLNNIWEKLSGEKPKVIFHLLSMNDLGLPDDLYIKMNARGKPLTDFEHFKSSFSEILEEKHAKYFNERIDGEWADLFWNIFKDKDAKDIAKSVDEGFLRFFWYITNIKVNQDKITFESDFWLNRVKAVYKNNPENVQFLFDCLDLFVGYDKSDKKPFAEIFYVKDEEFSVSKTKLFFGNAQSNLFHKCVENYSAGSLGFAIGEQLLLYAFIQINLNGYDVPDNFYRLLRNLIENATDKQIRNENLGNLYQSINALIAGERSHEKLLFTSRQLNEEATKQELIDNNPEFKEIIYRLEDHTLLRGTIGVFILDDSIDKLGRVFLRVFYTNCDYVATNMALLTFGFYPQLSKGFHVFGNKFANWRDILTQSDSREGFENTKSILNEYLTFRNNNPEMNNAFLIKNYLENTVVERNFIYYYLKYDSFAFWNGSLTDGYYYWKDFKVQPYECSMLYRTNFRGRSWSPFLLELSIRVVGCTLENYDNSLQFSKGNLFLTIEHRNNGFKFSAPQGEEFSLNYLNSLIVNEGLDGEAYLVVKQDENGIDQVDRIEACVDFLNSLILE